MACSRKHKAAANTLDVAQNNLTVGVNQIMNSDFVVCDVATTATPSPAALHFATSHKASSPKANSPKARRGVFFAAAVATAFCNVPSWAASSGATEMQIAPDASAGASKMGALNSAISGVIQERAVAKPVNAKAQTSFINADAGLDALDDDSRLLMAEISRLAMSQAASGRVAGAGLLWADVASSEKALRHASFARPNRTSSFVVAKHEYSRVASAGALRLVAQEKLRDITQRDAVNRDAEISPKTASATASAKTAPTRIARSRNKAVAPTIAPALPLVTRSESTAPTTSATTVLAAPTILRGTSSTNAATPSRAGVSAARRLVSLSPLQSQANLTARKNAGAGMKKVITVSSLKQLPPASQPLPMRYKGSRRASIIPIGVDSLPSNSRAVDSVSVNNSATAATAATSSTRMTPARPMLSPSRMANQLEVATGTFVVLQTATDLDTVAIADPAIADVAVVNSRAVLVNGKTPGITSLVIVDRDKIRQYQVRVVSAPGTLPRDIVAQIGLPGVSVRQVRDALFLDGEVENAEESRRAAETASVYSKKVINNLTVRGVPTGDTAIAARLQGLIGLPNVTVSLFGDSVLLQGTADNAAQRALAEQVASVSGRKVLNLIQSPLLSVEDVQASFSSVPSGATTGSSDRVSESFDPTSITVNRVGDQIVLTGTALDQARADQAIAIAARSGLQVINRIRLVPPSTADEQFSRRVEAAIGIPTVRVSGSAKRIVLTGTVLDTNVSNYVVQVARSIASEVDNMMTTPNPIQINIDVQIVEINTNTARNLGVQVGATTLGPITLGTPAVAGVAAVAPVQPLPGTGTTPGTPGTPGTPAIPGRPATPDTRSVGTDFRQGEALLGNYGFGGFQLLDALRFRLQALYSNGNARLLSNPRSTVLSGRTATFQVGGQVPIPVGSTTNGSGTSTTIEFKDFGIQLETNAVGNNDGVVTMRIRTEVSQPDPTIGIVPPGGGGLIPGFSRRQTVTEVTVGRGGTVALGGLIQNNITQTITRIPLLSRIPILGRLFESKQFQKNQSELVVFVTPRVLSNTLPAGSEAFAGVTISDATSNIGTQLGNPGITNFSSGGSIATGG